MPSPFPIAPGRNGCGCPPTENAGPISVSSQRSSSRSRSGRSLTIYALLELALKGGVIDGPDHILIRPLRAWANRVLPFRRAISIDFEYRADPGCNPHVWCLVATDLTTGQEIGRWWRDKLLTMHKAPFPTDRDTLVVSYAISAEMACFLQLSWKPPEYLLDLYAEYRWFTNGKHLVFGGKDATKLKKHKNSMLAAAFILGVPTMDTARKEEMRQLAMTRWSFAPEEQTEEMNYCAEDTTIAGGIFNKLAQFIDWPRALLRGRYGLAIARMERIGVPIDVTYWRRLQANWNNILRDLIEVTNTDYGVFRNGVVSDDLLADYAKREGYEWPLTATGRLRRDKKAMKQLALMHPKVNALKELLSTMGKGRLMNLAVGPDGYNRTADPVPRGDRT